jgi:CheY-like chemotaxis protein
MIRSLRARVLVIDDEPRISRAVARALHLAFGDGVVVTALERARDALALLLGGAEFDLIFCDVMMPDMDGLALHAELVARAPELVKRFVFLTGATYLVPLQTIVQRWGNEWLAKPIDLGRVRAMVAEHGTPITPVPA